MESNAYVRVMADDTSGSTGGGQGSWGGNKGEQTFSYYIYWQLGTTEESIGGLTNTSWYTDNANSPFHGYEANMILNFSETDINRMLTEWALKEGIDRNDFIRNIMNGDCWAFA